MSFTRRSYSANLLHENWHTHILGHKRHFRLCRFRYAESATSTLAATREIAVARLIASQFSTRLVERNDAFDCTA